MKTQDRSQIMSLVKDTLMVNNNDNPLFYICRLMTGANNYGKIKNEMQ